MLPVSLHLRSGTVVRFEARTLPVAHIPGSLHDLRMQNAVDPQAPRPVWVDLRDIAAAVVDGTEETPGRCRAGVPRAACLHRGGCMFSHLYEIVLHRAAAYPTEVAFGSQEGLAWRLITGAELLERVDRAALELAAAGVAEGSRVVVWAPNHWRTVAFMFGLWKLGAVVVPFDREMSAEAGRRIIAAVEPAMVLRGYGEAPGWAEGASVTEWWEPGSRTPADAPVGPWTRPSEELATISFTSGTTGHPKGCMITHANLCSQVDALGDTVPLDPTCRLASVLPLSHLFELTVGMLYPLACGAAVYHVPSRRAADVVRVFQEHRITHVVGVPQLLTLMGHGLVTQLRARLPAWLFDRLWRLAGRLPRSARRALFFPVHRRLGGSLRQMASGGAALPPETAELWERLGVEVLQGYGTSECSPVVTSMVAGEAAPPGSVGRPLRGVEVRLSPEGELLVRGPNVMRGYWQDPERTAAAFQDGWYATGDLASIDERGYVTILGRVKDLIVLPSGMNVWPEDVEAALRAAPGVRDAAVVPVATALGGATLHAYLLPQPGAQVELERVLAEANARLAPHQRVATASWWPEADFPRTNLLKVKRHLLPPPGVAPAPAEPPAARPQDPVLQAVAEVSRRSAVDPGQTLAALGIDSLGLVELAAALEEKTGAAVDEDQVRTDMTVAQLQSLVAGRGAAAPEAAPEEEWPAEQPLWPYTWGRVFRLLSFPFDLLYRAVVTRTVVLGAEHLAGLPDRVIFAGTHHGNPDVMLVRQGLRRTPARALAGRLVVATNAAALARAGLLTWYGVLAFGLFPLRQYRQRADSLRRMVRACAAGNALLIFPQGQHADPALERADDPSVAFHTGVAHLAWGLRAVVVPFGVAGTDQLMPPDIRQFRGYVSAGIPVSVRRGPLAIAFGQPLTPGAEESAEAFTARLQAACYTLTRRAEQALAA